MALSRDEADRIAFSTPYPLIPANIPVPRLKICWGQRLGADEGREGVIDVRVDLLLQEVCRQEVRRCLVARSLSSKPKVQRHKHAPPQVEMQATLIERLLRP
jgi:hypothetical protein